MYSSVPTNEFVRKFAMHERVSMAGIESARPPPFLDSTMPGLPPPPDCLERSKSDSMMWPDWWSRMSGGR
jgi:hypothetical protein